MSGRVSLYSLGLEPVNNLAGRVLPLDGRSEKALGRQGKECLNICHKTSVPQGSAARNTRSTMNTCIQFLGSEA